MSFFSFANPAGLWFLPLAGLPLLIHLFRRRRAAVVPFPDLRLLQQIQNAAIRPSRIKEYLLLAVRTLIILLLALSLARPMVSLNLPGWLSGASQTCVIIMDNSASMAAKDRDTTMLNQAKRSAGQALKTMGPNTRAAVISAVPGSPVILGLSSAQGAARAIAALPQTELGTDLDGAIHAADKILENSGSAGGRIMIFSDFFKTAFGPKLQPVDRLSASPVVSLFPAKSVRPLRNLIWQKVQTKPLIKRIIVQAQMQGGQFSQIGLAARGKAIYRTDPIPDREGKITLSFGLPDQDSLYLFTSADDLPLDDKYYLAATGPAIKKVLLLTDNRDDGNDYLYRAFSALAGAGFKITKTNTWESQYSKGYDLIVINKALLDRPLQEAMIKLMHKGAGLLAVPSLDSDISSYNYLIKQFSDIMITELADSLPHNIYRLNKAGREEDILSDLSQVQMDGIRIKTYWKAFSREKAALNINRTDPVLVFSSHQTLTGAVLLTGDQPRFGDLVFKPAFLVMLLQTANQLTQKATRQLVAGQNPTGPDNYQTTGWIRGSGGGMEAVNIAAAESDLTPVSGPELKEYFQNVSWQAAESGSGALAGRNPAVRLFLFLSGLLLILEMILRLVPVI
jgi:hypothetical protein